MQDKKGKRGKKGFSSLMAIILLALASAMAGTLVSRVSAKSALIMENARQEALVAAARFGIKSAEDWLLGAISSGNIPSGRKTLTSSPYEYIEAATPDGGRAEHESPFKGIRTEIYVADASYGPDVFPDGAVSIPDMPEESTPHGIRRYYFLQSSSTHADGVAGLVCEELLSVTVAADRIAAVERIFFRSRPK